jgi:hypothetical protein
MPCRIWAICARVGEHAAPEALTQALTQARFLLCR